LRASKGPSATVSAAERDAINALLKGGGKALKEKKMREEAEGLRKVNPELQAQIAAEKAMKEAALKTINQAISTYNDGVAEAKGRHPASSGLTGVDSAAASTLAPAEASAPATAGEAGVGSAPDGPWSWFGDVTSALSRLGKAAAGAMALRRTFGVMKDLSDEALEAEFKRVDADGGGTISREELQEHVVATFGQAIDEQVLDAMMAAADEDGNGEVDLEEFKTFMRTAADVHKDHAPFDAVGSIKAKRELSRSS